ncbi:protein Ycf2, partial [Biomphalaria glabrata]
KRAQETINFGNQQNKPRVLAKKSDLSNLLLPVAPLDEKDKSGVVVAHDALPVPPDMNARAEAALERNKDQEKMKEEMEAALQEAETKVPSQ